MKLTFAVLLLMASVPLALGQAGGTYTTIDFPSANSTVAEGIDTAGDIVGYFVDSSNSVHGFLLSDGVYIQLDAPGANETTAMGINDNGQIVGGTGSTVGLFVYDIAAQTYTTYAWDSNHSNVTATSINNAGVIVGWAFEASPFRTVGFELVGSTFQQISIPNAPSTELLSINNSGTFVAITSKNGRDLSYLGEPSGKFQELAIPAYHGYAVAINDSNVLTGNYVLPARNSAFEWKRKGPFEPINEPNERNTFANGINNAGQLVGEYYETSFAQGRGFLWTPPAAAKK